MSPTARCLQDLRAAGWKAWVVEASIRQFKRDLFNCIDVISIRPGETLAIQVTSGSHHADRVAKVKANDYLADMLAANWRVEVWSYSKPVSGKWKLRVESIPGADQ